MMIRIVSMSYVALCALLVFGLYHVKNESKNLEKQGQVLDQQIGKAEGEIRVLQAEWATRTAPDYLTKLVAQHLPRLHPAEPKQIASLASIAKRPLDAPNEDTIARLLSAVEPGAEKSHITRPTL